MKFKVICSDLDGTLLDNEGKLSDENSQAIKRMTEEGILFVPTTGRTICELPSIIKNHGSFRYYIYSNGSAIYDKFQNQKYETLVTKDDAAAVFDVLKKYDVFLAFHKDGGCFVDGECFGNADNYIISEAYKALLSTVTVIPKDFIDFCKNSGEMEMICAFFGKKENQEKCKAELSKITGIQITSSADGNIEIISAVANKGNAVKKFLRLVGAELDEAICVGDSTNDVEMLDAVDFSLAVGNAKPEVKSAASQVICKNTEHIAKYIYENFIQKN